MPIVYVRLIGAALGVYVTTVVAIVLWDRFVGYVDAVAALAAFAAISAGLAAILHGWLYVSLRQIIRKPA